MDFKKQHLELLADIAELDQGLVDREANLLHDLGLDSPPSEMPPNLSFVFADQTARDIERTEQDIAAESAPSPHFIQDSSSRRNDSSRQSSPSQSSNWRRAPAESAGLSVFNSAAKIQAPPSHRTQILSFITYFFCCTYRSLIKNTLFL